MDHIKQVTGWRDDPEWPALVNLISRTILKHRSKHPGTVTEEIICDLMLIYKFNPRDSRYRERRRNHSERIRRFTHQVFKVLDTSEEDAVIEKIATLVLSNFLLTPLRNLPASERSRDRE